MQNMLDDIDVIRSSKLNFKSDIINNLVFKPVIATGGIITDIVQDDVNYRVHTFLENGTFVCTSPGEVEYLIVGGGGGGGSDYEVAGAGGAGGMLFGNMIILSGTYEIIVGTGGASGTGAENQSGGGTNGTNGENSSFNDIIAIGGGYGGTRRQSGGTGGSGGGGGDGPSVAAAGKGGLGIAGQGFAGGDGNKYNTPSSYLDTGGGGGAGGNAGNPNSYSCGPGLSNSITGVPVIYAKGGNVYNDGGYVIGTPNTGNGGSTFRAGGSGIVIIRYKIENIIEDETRSETGSEIIINDVLINKALIDQGTFYNVTPSYILGTGIDSTDGFTIVGRSSRPVGNSDYSLSLRWVYNIDLTGYNTLKFNGKKNTNHGSIYIYISTSNVRTDVVGNHKFSAGYSGLDTSWHEYSIDVSDLNGPYYIIIEGGYSDNSGSTSSSTSYSNIRLLI